MTNETIRSATPDDIPAIQAVGQSAWQDTYTGLVPDGYIDAGFARLWTRASFEQALANPRARVLVAQYHSDIVGIIQVSYSAEGVATLWRLYLLRATRGRGLGRRLWDAATADLPPFIRTFRTSVVRGNPALRFYQRLGFHITHHVDLDYAGYRVPLSFLERLAYNEVDCPPTNQALVEADYSANELNYNTFMQPAYHSALATSAFPSGSCGLDLGCGPGGLLPLLAEQIGPAGHIVGVDVSRPHLTAARHLVADQGMEERVSVEWADLARPLPFADSVFDWVWCADTLWPGGSFDPVAAVREAARVTKPGGKIALWFIALRRGIVLPGEPLVEYTLRMAMDRTLYPAAPTALHSETALQWLRDAGLIDLRLSAHHVLARPPFDTAVRGYLEEYLLTEMRRIPRESVPEIGDDAWARWRRLSDPAAPEYLLNQPDYYCLQFGLLASGGVPDELQ